MKTDPGSYREGFIDAITRIAEMIEGKSRHEIFTKHYFAKEILKEIDKIRHESWETGQAGE